MWVMVSLVLLLLVVAPALLYAVGYAVHRFTRARPARHGPAAERIAAGATTEAGPAAKAPA